MPLEFENMLRGGCAMDSVISRVIYDNAFCAIKEPENSNEPKTGGYRKLAANSMTATSLGTRGNNHLLDVEGGTAKWTIIPVPDVEDCYSKRAPRTPAPAL